MRTIRTKQSNKRRKKRAAAENPIQTACTLAKITLDHLVIHRASWEIEGGYLKPYHKGTISLTINRLNGFLEKYNELPKEGLFKELRSRVLGTIKPYLLDVEKLNLNPTDTIIYKTMVISTLCLGTMLDMVKTLGFMYANLEADIKKIHNAFNSYREFWTDEVDLLTINFYD